MSKIAMFTFYALLCLFFAHVGIPFLEIILAIASGILAIYTLVGG